MYLPVVDFVRTSKRIGSVDFIDGRTNFFAGYKVCGGCNKTLKVLLDFDEVREFEEAVLGRERFKFGVRVLRRLGSFYGLELK